MHLYKIIITFKSSKFNLMIFLRSFARNFQYMEWIYITAHFGMCFNSPGYNLSALVGVYSIFFLLGWLFSCHSPYWQRCSYIVVALTIVVFIRHLRIDVGLFLFFYIAKSYILLGRRITIKITTIVLIAWTITEYFAELELLKSPVPIPPNSVFDPRNSLKFVFFTLLVYATASTFTIMFTSMMVAEQKKLVQHGGNKPTITNERAV